ncbi:MAG: 4-(cytidine 5'-diphospho)-2-C-methyl-D-erythritol kinase [Accumulibacter sp.]|jgi:4-diphosphocytidyl-2-C-methyl-D-erythritol kinase|uniref:4-(cytidine 5'-diphospho)-2-C-methyl-D-erythritol kinase n=1 Tax=Accumulibacter sp. TaxID=2053492 RepID=UPI002FC35BA4
MTSSHPAWDWQSIYPAPAKLNLFLHVVGRRADGYHLLQTMFRFLDHGDRLRFSPRADGLVRLATPLAGVAPDQELSVRAARLLQAETHCPAGVNIRIEKHLPLGGGLGGGSSDAATVLLALNHLWKLHLPRRHLQEIGLTLGADVPVFVFGRNAFAEGIGETLLAVELPPRWYVVLEPPLQVPTAAIFGAPELKRDSLAIDPASWRPGFGGNDLEAVACARFPAIAEHLVALSAFAPARMSGSGACIFAEFASREEAENALRQLPGTMRGWLATGLDRHPLCELARGQGDS